jgi:hypothetical protein
MKNYEKKMSEWKEIIIKTFVAIDGHYNIYCLPNVEHMTPLEIHTMNSIFFSDILEA